MIDFKVPHLSTMVLSHTFDKLAVKIDKDRSESDHRTDRTMRLEPLIAECYGFAQANFPNRTRQSMFLKMFEELGEVIAEKPGTPEHDLEVADLFILLFDYVRMTNVDVTNAVAAKLKINRLREWEIDPETQVMRHVSDE
jgi:NTP pyrophosphatase (non-canonical NTP hydrolase)